MCIQTFCLHENVTDFVDVRRILSIDYHPKRTTKWKSASSFLGTDDAACCKYPSIMRTFASATILSSVTVENYSDDDAKLAIFCDALTA